tara:strand:- start:2080 stop:3330 length:1251 start_codon:yes stop_codon:yes gene_type:complete
MKKTIFTLLVILGFAFTACMNDEAPPILQDTNNPVDPSDNIVNISGMISESTTWTNDNIYVLNQKVVVSSGVVLTIQAGTIIKGTEGNGSLASALIVAQGGKLNAVGTATEPIIFTSINDNIEVGQTAGTNLDETNSGLWGGLIVLGNAPCSFSGDVEVVQIEGIPADDTFGLYGGGDATDNSGVYQYISIRHGGALIGEGNEINGLTLGGVGSETIIDNIEVVANVDDGIEFFGGTVNASNLLVWAQGDDGLDIDQGYSGTINNAIVVLGSNSDHAFEIDGPEGTATGSFTLKNATIIGNSITENGEYADYRSGAMGTTENIYAYGFKDSSDVELDNDLVATNYNDELLTFGVWEIVLPAGVSQASDIFVNKAASVEVDGFGSASIAIDQGESTVGASTSLLSWSYTNSKEGLGF